MGFPLQITFRNMASSAAIEANIRERVAKLELFHDAIENCHVIVEAPHKHHRKGNVYQVHITLGVPGPDIVIKQSARRLDSGESGEPKPNGLIENHRTGKRGAHEDLYVALRDAFRAAERKLKDHAGRQNPALKARRTAMR